MLRVSQRYLFYVPTTVGFISASSQGIQSRNRRSGDRRVVIRLSLMTPFRLPFRQFSTYRPTMSSANWSRLIRFNPKSAPSTVLIGEPVDPKLDVGLASYKSEEIKVNVYSGNSVLDAGQQTGKEEVVERILSPLARSEVGTIRCIGLNVSPLSMHWWLTLVPHSRPRDGNGEPRCPQCIHEALEFSRRSTSRSNHSSSRFRQG